MSNDDTTTVDARIAQLTKQRDDLAACLKEVLEGFNSGVFVRDISGDGKPDWAMKLLPMVTLFNRCNAALLNTGLPLDNQPNGD